MSHDLIMDTSKEIFKLNKDILLFKINPSNQLKLSSHSSLQSSNLKPISEEDITVTNLTSDYLAFRAKTTKKDNYTVNPTYCVIPPNENKILNILLYNMIGQNLDSKGHKFKFEGFIIPESRKDEEVKDIFKDYIQKGIKVIGNSQKRYVKFSEENNDGPSPIVEEKDEEKFGIDNNKENNKEKFEQLKNEYNMLKEQVDNLKRNEELLNKRIINEKKRKNSSQGSNKFNYKIPTFKEEKISMNTLIGIFVISIFIGFYLVK